MIEPESGESPRPVRVIDTGIRGGRANVAFDQALIEAHRAGRIPATIRFLRFRPSALVGLHQILSHEVRLEYCRRQGIEVGRRITGGGGLYLDEGQIGWELVLARRSLGTTDLAAIARTQCDAVALSPADFREVVERAFRQLFLRAGGHSLRGHWLGPPPGEEPTLVFLHDALGCARLWRDHPDRLVKATGCGALLYDRWGSGDSEPLTPPFARDYLLREALEALPEVLQQARIRDAILVGQSDGAAIALAYAGAFPERVRGVIALSPHLFREAKTLAAIREQIRDFEHGDLAARLQRYHGAKTDALFRRLVKVWTADDASHGWGLEEYIARVRCRVLAIQGENDEFFSAAQLDALARLLPRHLERRRLPDCGHYVLQDARRKVIEETTRFVSGLRPARPAALASKVGE